MKKFLIVTTTIVLLLLSLGGYLLRLWPFYYLYPVPDSLNQVVSQKWLPVFSHYDIREVSFGIQPISQKPRQNVRFITPGKTFEWQFARTEISRVHLHVEQGNVTIYWDQTSSLPLDRAFQVIDDQLTLHYREFQQLHMVATSYQR